jgi:hypothetical protein
MFTGIPLLTSIHSANCTPIPYSQRFKVPVSGGADGGLVWGKWGDLYGVTYFGGRDARRGLRDGVRASALNPETKHHVDSLASLLCRKSLSSIKDYEARSAQRKRTQRLSIAGPQFGQ